MTRRVNWHARAQRFRNMAAECRALAKEWPDHDVATSLANASSELETSADAMIERHKGERR